MLIFCDDSFYKRMPLSAAKDVGEYGVCNIKASGSLKKRMDSLYISPGKKITLLFAKNGKTVIFTSGVKIGLSRSVSQKIEVFRYVEK